MRLFDTHTHLDDPAFDEDREALMASLPGLNVRKVLLCGANMESSCRVQELCRKDVPGLERVCAVGIHPHDAETLDDAALRELAAACHAPGCVAVGEIGLDYYYDLSPRPVQREAMLRQIEMANREHMPVIFHIRDAWGDFFDCMRELAPERANMHCWSGSTESLKRCLDLGMMIAYGGAVTFKNAHNLRETAKYVPDDRLLLETDCPYLTPVPFRGKRNDPSKTAFVAQCLAEVRGTDAESIAERTWDNAERFFCGHTE